MGVLKDKLIEEIKLRGFADSTQKNYVTNVEKFIIHMKISPQKLTLNNVRDYKLFLINSKKSPRTINQNIASIKFFLYLF